MRTIAGTEQAKEAILYICYLGTSDPLVDTQVVASSGGWRRLGTGDSMTFEPGPRDRAREAGLEAQLAAQGIAWERLPYHKRPSLPATIYDVLRGVLKGLKFIRRHRIDVVHATLHAVAPEALAGRPARDAFRRETFALPREAAREKAREMFRRFPKAAYMTAIESLRVLPGDRIEFTVRRLPTAD